MVNRAGEEAAPALPAPAGKIPLAAPPPIEAVIPAADAAAPGPLAVEPTGELSKLSSTDKLKYAGYLWLFGVSLIWLVRMLADPTMVRRPLLEPNASKGCLVFLGCSL